MYYIEYHNVSYPLPSVYDASLRKHILSFWEVFGMCPSSYQFYPKLKKKISLLSKRWRCFILGKIKLIKYYNLSCIFRHVVCRAIKIKLVIEKVLQRNWKRVKLKRCYLANRSFIFNGMNNPFSLRFQLPQFSKNCRTLQYLASNDFIFENVYLPC